MLKAFASFLRDESGAVTVDSVTVLGGSVWMATAIVGDISVATIDVGTRISDRLEYNNIVAEILHNYGPADNGGTEGGSGSSEVDCAGNPGNDKCVGNAGENPNGQGGWGSGSNGMSDGDNGNSNSGSGNSANGNSGNGHGHGRGHR